MPEGPATILGGLPVIAVVSFGVDDSVNGREYWSEVETLHWQKKDGSKGKEIPQHIRDRAEEYDYGLCSVTEQVSDYLAYGDRDEPEENVSFDLLDSNKAVS